MTVPYWPRLMKRSTAARYCDLAPAKFSAEVMSGRFSLPVKIGGEDHWDRAALDEDISRSFGRVDDWEKDQPGLAA